MGAPKQDKPKPLPPPPLPERAPDPELADVQRRALAIAGQGRRSTILTGALGARGAPNTAAPVALPKSVLGR